MPVSHFRKTPGAKVIPMRRFETTHEEDPVPRKSSTPSQRREDYISEQIVVTLKNLLESLRPLKT